MPIYANVVSIVFCQRPALIGAIGISLDIAVVVFGQHLKLGT